MIEQPKKDLMEYMDHFRYKIAFSCSETDTVATVIGVA
jgi:hypothetical protein